jgi:hypothetical protein
LRRLSHIATELLLYGVAEVKDKPRQLLLDYGATKKATEAAIRKLVAGGRRGDVLVVHFSGHG